MTAQYPIDTTPEQSYDTQQTATMLGRTLVITFALTVALTITAIAPGTWASAAALAAAAALIGRVIYIAHTSNEDH